MKTISVLVLLMFLTTCYCSQRRVIIGKKITVLCNKYKYIGKKTTILCNKYIGKKTTVLCNKYKCDRIYITVIM